MTDHDALSHCYVGPPSVDTTLDGLLLLFTLALAAFEGRNLDLAAAARAAHADPAHFNAGAKVLGAFDARDLDPVVAARELAARTDPTAVKAVATAAFDAYVGSTRNGK
jgi:hypothetical protein